MGSSVWDGSGTGWRNCWGSVSQRSGGGGEKSGRGKHVEPDEQKTGTTEEPEEESFGEMFDRSFVAPTRYEPGRKVSALVVKVTPEWVFLDLGRKGEGVLAAKELLDEAGAVRVKEGDAIEAYFVSSDGSEMLF